MVCKDSWLFSSLTEYIRANVMVLIHNFKRNKKINLITATFDVNLLPNFILTHLIIIYFLVVLELKSSRSGGTEPEPEDISSSGNCFS